MNTTEEFAGIHLSVLKEVSKKALEVLQELLKALILKSTQGDKVKAGKTNLANLVKSGEQLKFTEIDKQDIKPLMKLAKKYKVPVAIIKNGDVYKAAFKESDLSRVSELLKDMHTQKLMSNEMQEDELQKAGKLKEVVLDEQDARFFKNRAKDVNMPVYFYDTENGKKKVAFNEADVGKAKEIIKDLEVEKQKIPQRKISFDSLKDKMRATVTGKPTLRLYDAELNRSVRFDLPISKQAFVKSIKSAFGYTDKEAKNMVSRLESGKGYDGIIAAGIGKEAIAKWQWKEDYKEQFSQLQRMEKDIKLSKEPESLQNYSYSTITLADGKDTKMVTVTEKGTDKSYSTQPIDKATFEKEVKEHLGVSDAVAKDMAEKAAKLGFITDEKEKKLDLEKPVTKESTKKAAPEKKDAPTFEEYQINKSSRTNTVTFTYDSKTLKADISNKDETVLGLQKTFGLSPKSAEGLYNKASKQGVQEAVKTATKKAEIHKTTVKEKTTTKEKSVGAR